MLATSGANRCTAMELLGHLQISLTMEVYSQVARSLEAEAAAKVNELLG